MTTPFSAMPSAAKHPCTTRFCPNSPFNPQQTPNINAAQQPASINSLHVRNISINT